MEQEERRKMTCRDCIHYDICTFHITGKENEKCLHFSDKADVVEVKHGEWKLKSKIHMLFDDVDEEFYVECPFCGRTEWIPFEFEEEKMLEYAIKHFPYCHCGVRMDGKEQEE